MGRKIAWLLLIFSTSCQNEQDRKAQLRQLQQQIDKAAESRIDSAYSAIKLRCDSLIQFKAPLMADSLLRLQDSITQHTGLKNDRK